MFFYLNNDPNKKGFIRYNGEKSPDSFERFKVKREKSGSLENHFFLPLVAIEYGMIDRAKTDKADFSVREGDVAVIPLYLGSNHTISLDVIAASPSEIKFINKTPKKVATFH